MLSGKRDMVLRPDNGHMPCATRAPDGHKVRMQYATIDGSASCGDKYYNLNRKATNDETDAEENAN